MSKSYGAQIALQGVSLDLQPGEFVGLLGPNGAGKSTLFQICAGLFAPDTGTVQLFGLEYGKKSSLILSQLGIVFQARSLDADITVRANLRFFGGLFGLFGRRLKQRVIAVAVLMDIEPLLDKPVRSLSGGNQRRAEIARALLPEPKVLLLDEPTTGLDATARRNLVSHVRRIVATTGLSVLWATHLVEEVADADRIALLIRGEVKAVLSPAALIAQAGASDLTEAYITLTGSNTGPNTGPKRLQ
ncbi:MAG: ATP-binding cassette domain-containing protein [Cypionkella sp.]|uniref:ATP-binding cassette domain-containing protein n=1 Tax=Cypionkella sp. TaxID=2811411 RepID=UPI00271EF5FE|nr:ATP-binding cassette domain-containing protein [Cypionkella sp.]MDO8327377.1 ATP-binding cassette domain-containing protein [Cypionkella sp.]